MTLAGQVGLGTRIAAGSSPLTPLLTGAVLVGGIYNLDYDTAIVVTNDIDKRRAGGIPKHCFLLARRPAEADGTGRDAPGRGRGHPPAGPGGR